MEYTEKTCYTPGTTASPLKIPPADVTYIQIPLLDAYTVISQLRGTDFKLMKPEAKELLLRWKHTLGI